MSRLWLIWITAVTMSDLPFYLVGLIEMAHRMNNGKCAFAL
jgi:hypothetical protein